MKRTGAHLKFQNKIQLRFLTGVLCLAVIVATAAALTGSALTMEKNPQCGLSEHTHNEQCYELRKICAYEKNTDAKANAIESADAVQNGDAEQTDDNEKIGDMILICGREELEGVHQHTEECYHTHTEECFERVLVCQIPEHVHTDACYSKGEQSEPEPLTATGEAPMTDVFPAEELSNAGLSSAGECAVQETEAAAEDRNNMDFDTAFSSVTEIPAETESSEETEGAGKELSEETETAQEIEYEQTESAGTEEITETANEGTAAAVSTSGNTEEELAVEDDSEEDDAAKESTGTGITDELLATANMAETVTDETGNNTLLLAADQADVTDSYGEMLLVCGKEEHIHDELCYDEAGNLICTTEEHKHDESCYEQPLLLAKAVQIATASFASSSSSFMDLFTYHKPYLYSNAVNIAASLKIDDSTPGSENLFTFTLKSADGLSTYATTQNDADGNVTFTADTLANGSYIVQQTPSESERNSHTNMTFDEEGKAVTISGEYSSTGAEWLINGNTYTAVGGGNQKYPIMVLKANETEFVYAYCLQNKLQAPAGSSVKYRAIRPANTLSGYTEKNADLTTVKKVIYHYTVNPPQSYSEWENVEIIIAYLTANGTTINNTQSNLLSICNQETVPDNFELVVLVSNTSGYQNLVTGVVTGTRAVSNTVAFANTTSAPVPSSNPRKPLQTVIKAQKTIDGAAPEADYNEGFSFQITDADGNRQIKTNNADGNITFEVPFDANGAQTVYEKAGTYTYTITEIKGERSDINYDSTAYTVEVTIGEEDLYNLTGDTYYGFSSSQRYYVSTNQTDSGFPVFCINFDTLAPPNDRNNIREYTPVIDPDSDTLNDYVGTDKYGEQLTENLRKLFYYLELHNEDYDDNTKKNLIYAATNGAENGHSEYDGFDEQLSAIYNSDIEVPDNYQLVLFVPNDYDPSKSDSENNQPLLGAVGPMIRETDGIVFNNTTQSSLKVTVRAQKTLDGAAPGEDYNNFNFQIKDSDGNIQTRQNTPEGNITFELPFDADGVQTAFPAPGAYEYTVSEVDDGRTGIKYDTGTSYSFKVIAGVDDPYEYSEDCYVIDDCENCYMTIDPNSIIFQNETVTPVSTPITATVSAAKTFDGTTPGENHIFNFQITDAGSGGYVQTRQNNAGGTITFGLPFDQDGVQGVYQGSGTYTYTVSEVNEGQTGIAYDSTIYNVTVTLKDKDFFDFSGSSYNSVRSISYDYFVKLDGGDIYLPAWSINPVPQRSSETAVYSVVVAPDSETLAKYVNSNKYGDELAEKLRKLLYYFDAQESNLNAATRMNLILNATLDGYTGYESTLNTIYSQTIPDDYYLVLFIPEGYNGSTSSCAPLLGSYGAKISYSKSTSSANTAFVEAGSIVFNNVSSSPAGYRLPETGGSGISSVTSAGLLCVAAAAVIKMLSVKRRTGGTKRSFDK